MKELNILFAIIVLIYSRKASASQCMDESNNPVDWFVAYKLPLIPHDENELIRLGLSYVYMTSSNCSHWILSAIPINETNSLIANSIHNLYAPKKDNNSYIIYNDETPYKIKNSEKGHTKGIVLTNNQTGLWLIHSVPKFPGLNSYNFPSTGLKFGQSFLCISFDLVNIDKVGIQLQYNEPEIYAQYIPEHLKTKMPNLAAAAANVTVKVSPWYNQLVLYSKEGAKFISFAKSKHFGKDLYEDWVAPALESDLLVETWLDGPGRLNSDCSKKFKVKNVKSIILSVLNVTFTSTDDHSKWAISSTRSATHWLCIGDINRAEHQKKRGGGTVCLNNDKLATAYQMLVKTVEECQFNNIFRT